MAPEVAILFGIFAPLAVALLIPFVSIFPMLRDGLGTAGALVAFAAAIVVGRAVLSGAEPDVTLLAISPGLDLRFRISPPGAVFGCVASGLWVLASLYSTGYMRGNNEKHLARFAACYAVAIHAAMAIAWSGNLMTLFIFYEILTFSTYPLVTHKENKEAIMAGRLYMGLLVGTSFVLFLPAIIWVWLVAGTLDFTPGGILAGRLDPALAPWLVALFAFGIGKAALMPIHRWLPAAMVAPAPVSALLHAVAVVKAGAFTVLIVMVYVFGIDFLADTGASAWLAWLAAFTILAASLIAMSKDDLKARLAYSTVSQLSYIVLAAALASRLAAEAGLLHIVMHATAKITLFFCAGAIYVGAHLTKVSQLDGLGPRMPMVFAAFFIGALSIIGIPPLGGSWSKLLLMGGAVEAGMGVMVAVLIVSTLLNVWYLLEPVFRAFFRPVNAGIRIQSPVLTVYPPVATALICVALFFTVDMLASFGRLMVAP